MIPSKSWTSPALLGNMESWYASFSSRFQGETMLILCLVWASRISPISTLERRNPSGVKLQRSSFLTIQPRST